MLRLALFYEALDHWVAFYITMAYVTVYVYHGIGKLVEKCQQTRNPNSNRIFYSVGECITLFYGIHFVTAGIVCNLIGSKQCALPAI
jgi:hypothetical protein